MEQDFLEQALAGAWQSAQQKYGPDPAAWNDRARKAVQQQRLGYYEASMASRGSTLIRR